MWSCWFLLTGFAIFLGILHPVVWDTSGQKGTWVTSALILDYCVHSEKLLPLMCVLKSTDKRSLKDELPFIKAEVQSSEGKDSFFAVLSP